PGDANPSARGQVLQTSGDVYTIAVDAFSVDDDISQIDADPKLHLTLEWKLGVSDAKVSLDGDRALYGIDDAGKLREYVIPGRVDDATSMFLHEVVDHCPVNRHGVDCCCFILTHQPT